MSKTARHSTVGNGKPTRGMRQTWLLPAFHTFSTEQLQIMAAAGREVLECQRVLAKAGTNIIAEVLPPDGKFNEFDHCPPGDIYDSDTHSQYYYHSHRPGEHGHFHTFLREKGMPNGAQPVEQSEAACMKERDDRVGHLVAISMDERGVPIGLFTTNRWVTGENWYSAEDVVTMVDHFEIDHARPSWATNRWISAMLRLFRPQIVALLRERDAAVAEWHKTHPDEDVFEDRRLELPASTPISIDQQIRAVQTVLDAHVPVAQSATSIPSSIRYRFPEHR